MQNIAQLKEQTAKILEDVNRDLKVFPAEQLQLLYAKQIIENNFDLSAASIENNAVYSTEKDKQRFNKMIEDAKLKWTFATNKQKDIVLEIETIIEKGKNKIKALYENS